MAFAIFKVVDESVVRADFYVHHVWMIAYNGFTYPHNTAACVILDGDKDGLYVAGIAKEEYSVDIPSL